MVFQIFFFVMKQDFIWLEFLKTLIAAIELLEDILQIDPTKRPKSDAILRHAYFKLYYDRDTRQFKAERFDNSFERVNITLEELNSKSFWFIESKLKLFNINNYFQGLIFDEINKK